MSYKTTSLIARTGALAAILFLTYPMDLHAGLIKVNERCSLVDAITAANTDMAVGGCFAGSGLDVLSMTKPGKLTTVLPGGNGTPTIVSDIIIRANGRSIYRALPDNFRLFDIASTGFLRIENARMFEGRHPDLGGAIQVQDGGSLQLINCIIEDSFAGLAGGAIAAGAGSETLIIQTTFRNNSAANAGAFFNRGASNVYVSTFEGNSTDGIGNTVLNTGTLNMSWSTLSGNTDGDTVFFNGGMLTMTNCTLENNSSDTHGLLNGGTTMLIGCNIEYNTLGTLASSAAVRNNGSMTAMDTTIRLNTPQNCSGFPIGDGLGNEDSDPDCF